MEQEFVTLPRDVVEQALEAMSLALSDVDWRKDSPTQPVIHKAYNATRAALDQPQAEQPAMTPIAQRKLDSLLAGGYTISGYSVYHEQKHQHGFVTGAGLVGWWKPEGVEHPQPQGEQEPVAWQYRMRPDWGIKKDCWGPWQDCTREQAAMYQRVQLLHDWVYESRQLYTHPQPKREPLTDERIIDIADDYKTQWVHGGQKYDQFDSMAFTRAIEAAHNIK